MFLISPFTFWKLVSASLTSALIAFGVAQRSLNESYLRYIFSQINEKENPLQRYPGAVNNAHLRRNVCTTMDMRTIFYIYYG